MGIGVGRVTARPGAFVLAAVGVALAAFALASVSAASLVVRDRSVSRAIAELPPSQRSVEVTWVGPGAAPENRWPALDRRVRATARRLGVQRPATVLLYRDSRLGQSIVRLGAVDGLARAVSLRSGRLPRPCVPGRCEVVSIDADGLTGPGLATVGRATLRPGATEPFLVGAVQGNRLLLAEGVARASRLPKFADAFRTYGWIAPLRPGDIRAWDVDGFQRRLDLARTALAVESPRFGLIAPTAAIADAGAKSRIAGRRLLLVGGQAVVMLLAFVLLVATRLRREAQASRNRLESFGATSGQTASAALAEAAIVVVPATIVGWLLGVAAALMIAEATDTPAWALVSRSVLSPTAGLLALAVAAAGTLVLYAGARVQPIAVGGRAVTIADVIGVAALAALVVAFALGGADASSLASSGGTGFVLLLLPGLIAVVAAVLLARVLQPLLRLGERLAAHRSLSLKLALLSLARAPGTATAAVVFVTVSIGLAVFASTYRSTLLRNDADRASFEVPLDYRVRQDSRFVSHSTPVGPAYAARFDAIPVLRQQAEAPSLNRRGVTLLGIPAAELSRLRWRDDFSSSSPGELADRIGGPTVELRGAQIPESARELRLPLAIHGDEIHLSANVRTRDGRFLVLDLGEPPTGEDTVARASLPAAARGGRLVGLVVEFTRAEEFTSAHRATGGDTSFDVFRTGTLRLGRPLAVGPLGARPLAVDYRNWVDAKGSAPTGASAGSIALHYLLTQEQVFRLRPRQATDGGAIPVLASESITRALGDTVLPLFVGNASVNVRPVATARRFPTASGDFVVADRSRLETAMNASVPGSALADEAWVSGPAGETQRLTTGSPTPVRVTSRREVEAELRSDPLARGSLLVLGAAALAALVLSLGGLALTVAVDMRDETGELFDLETQGMGPAALRRQLRLRAAAVLVAGLVGGLVLGVALALTVLEALAVSANSTEPVPPLVLAPDWGALAVGGAVFLLVTIAVVVLLTRAAFREQSAVPAVEPA